MTPRPLSIQRNIPFDNLQSNYFCFPEKILTLESQNDELREKTVCKVCLDCEISVVFTPCGHFVCCPGCAEQVTSCPVCRRFIALKVNAFIS